MDSKKIRPAQIIVDLFELRGSFLTPQYEKWERVTFDYQYHSLSIAISLLIEKYKVEGHEIEDEIKYRRSIDLENKYAEYSIGYGSMVETNAKLIKENATEEEFNDIVKEMLSNHIFK